jgi:flagellar motility protein MotE (MotC chaperone)
LKNIIIYAVIFLLAFAATSYEIYTLNNKYVNVFKFDFRDKVAFEKKLADSLAVLSVDSTNIVHGDSLAVADSLTSEKKMLQTSTIESDSIKNELNDVKQKLSQKDKEIEELKNQLNGTQDIKYQDWLKNTIKIYEEMESNKAAQLIQGIPENQARDIIYSMKKKKAAEILSYLENGTVQRLTKAK